ncbi:carboxypeptidase D-like [Teleopsis dalmanni]|uniref:carboxypeptidase D-like n=1 Tax=Teleopsis dalmanni TaxID=139649 RepID=UPI0018CE51F7|nr:carboxypeptidase D-like [Teleopsis dalmanni]
MTEEYEPEAVFPDDQYAGCVFVCKDPLPEDDNKVIREYFMDKYYRRWLRMTCIHKKERLMEHKWINYITKESAAHMFVRLDTGELFAASHTSNVKFIISFQEGNCESLPKYIGRTNAAGVDLNRDFPDRLENEQVIQLRSQTRQPETAAIIEWIASKPFVLSANFHGGAVVASYPYDNSIAHHECCEESLTPDDRVFKLMAHTYADNHPIMRQGNNCNDSFSGGITNGANWYELNGGMQDFNYAFTNCFELTIELSCCKYPLASTLPTEWARNKHSLLQLLKLAHIGVKGIIKDASGYPIQDATVVVSGLEDKPIRTTRRGEYWRMLTPGIYNIQAQAFGYQASVPQQIQITNDNTEALRIDFTLLPTENNYDGISSFYSSYFYRQ